MPADVGTQDVTLIFGTVANSSEVNARFMDVRKTGIYSGGYPSVVDTSNAQISTLVCEISDGTYQVKVETTVAVNLAVALATPYIVLRWEYTGASDDYMEILAVATPAANDLVVAKCSFSGSDLIGFNLNDTTYPRSTPNVFDINLKVEATPDTEMRVRVRAGKFRTHNATISIADQKSGLFTAPGSNSRIDLVYLNRTTGAVAIQQGTAAASPSAPSYAGKFVLAEVTVEAGDTDIVASAIKDVRPWLIPFSDPDGSTIDYDATTGKLKVIGLPNGVVDSDALGSGAVIPAKVENIFGIRTSLDKDGSALDWNVGASATYTIYYQAECDGILTAIGTVATDTCIGASVKIAGGGSWIPVAGEGSNSGTSYMYGISVPVAKGDYVALHCTRTKAAISGSIYWLPIGSGDLDKQ
jgi:hypothetical protein